MKVRKNSQSGKVSERNSRRQLENEQLVKKPDFLKAATLGQIFIVCTQQLGGLEDGKITKLQFRKFLMTEQICFVFNLMGLGLSVMQYDLEFEEENEDISNCLLWIIFISTLVLLVLTVLRYQQHMNWLKSRKQISQNDRIWQTEQWYPMLIELIIYCVVPYPFTIGMRVYFYNSFQDATAYYHVNEILALFMITRTVFIFRTILAQTFWYSNRTQRVCNLYATLGASDIEQIINNLNQYIYQSINNDNYKLQQYITNLINQLTFLYRLLKLLYYYYSQQTDYSSLLNQYSQSLSYDYYAVP
ncbi:unnamed protein product [Paramecium octaurelia]|uniref:Uncharacterized protein n=1 Tax=Paramecium octaurelia TaxID=43137 RepID=A0A8S1XDH0_PAROT|nr:unnamed protein product [Paramecium octaurelia]